MMSNTSFVYTLFIDNRISTSARTSHYVVTWRKQWRLRRALAYGDENMGKHTRTVTIDWENQIATASAHTGDINYSVRMHFNDKAQLVRAAVEKCIIEVNGDGRAGKLRNGETYDVDCWGNIHKTDAQLVAEMSESDIERMKKLIAAKEESLKAAAAPAAEVDHKLRKKAA